MNVLLAFLLAIPVVSWFVAPVLGMFILFKLIARGGFSGVVLGFLGAAVWGVLSFAPFGYGIHSNSKWMLSIVVGSIIANLAFSYFFLAWVDRLYRGRIDAQLSAFYEKVAPTGNFADLIGQTLGPYFTFDKDKRLLVFVTEDGILEKPFDYIKTWQLYWLERNKNGIHSFVNVYMEFITTDIDRPRIVVPLPSKDVGDELNAKLSILIA